MKNLNNISKHILESKMTTENHTKVCYYIVLNCYNAIISLLNTWFIVFEVIFSTYYLIQF